MVLFLAPAFAFATTTYTFSSGFSSAQGANQWSYYQLQSSAYSPMTWDAAASMWRGGDGGFPLIGASSVHPGGNSDVVIKWNAPASGTYRITGTVADGDSSCGDGVIVNILQDSTTLWSAAVANGNTTGNNHSFSANLAAGDSLYFIVNRNASYDCDTTVWNPTVTRIANMGGALDGFTGGTAVGWALNADDYLQPTTVRFYFDAPYGSGGTYIGSATTDSPRTDLGVPGNHGYSFNVPDQYLDGTSHSLYAYAVAPDNSLIHLQTSSKTGTVSCGLSHCPTFPISSNDGQIKVETIGNAQYVFQRTVNKCGPNDGADSPARAFHDASGQVVFTAAHEHYTYRSAGSSLDTVQRSCGSGPIMGEGKNPDYNAITDMEWPTAPYSTDGTNVYALVHNEWHRPEILNPACTPGQAWVNAITLAVSNDGGLHFTHPVDYKIRTPEPWNSSFPCSASLWTQMGSFEPTNIVTKDGYYYALFGYMSPPVAPYTSGRGTVIGDCVMRTNDLSKGSAWQVWTGSGWSSAALTSMCAPIVTDGSIKTISYNTYLQQYVGVGGRFDGAGYGYALSQDLVHWSSIKPFLPVPLPQGNMAYISMLDPADASRNFERSGQMPYIYLVNVGTRDIIRQQIRFTDLAPAQTCTPNWSCTAWNQCPISGSQSRTCTDTNACGVSIGKPVESLSCTYAGNVPFTPVPVATLPTATSTAATSMPATATTTATTATTAQKIAALLAQIQQLQAILAMLKGGSAVVSLPPQTKATVTYNGKCPVLSRALFRGMSGSDVTALQKFLAKEYTNFTMITGFYGAVTEAAVKQWQKEHGIAQTGGAGPNTRTAIARCD